MANIAFMEPTLLRNKAPQFSELNELSFLLAKKSAALKASQRPQVAESIKGLIRSTNCYYSNLIEGRHTHPIEIENALRHDYCADPENRELKHEAIAHIETEKWIEQGGLSSHVTTAESIVAIHKYFCERLPEELLWVEGPSGQKAKVEPGQLRQQPVRVGTHIAVDHKDLPALMARFEKVYSTLWR
jgi:hypothetical protein